MKSAKKKQMQLLLEMKFSKSDIDMALLSVTWEISIPWISKQLCNLYLDCMLENVTV